MLCEKATQDEKPKEREVLGIGQDLSEEIVKRSLFVFEKKEVHFAAAGTSKRINRERDKKGEPPTGKRAKKRAFGGMNSRDEFGIKNGGRKSNRRIINAVITDHFEMLIRDMNN